MLCRQASCAGWGIKNQCTSSHWISGIQMQCHTLKWHWDIFHFYFFRFFRFICFFILIKQRCDDDADYKTIEISLLTILGGDKIGIYPFCDEYFMWIGHIWRIISAFPGSTIDVHCASVSSTILWYRSFCSSSKGASYPHNRRHFAEMRFVFLSFSLGVFFFIHFFRFVCASECLLIVWSYASQHSHTHCHMINESVDWK